MFYHRRLVWLSLNYDPLSTITHEKISLIHILKSLQIKESTINLILLPLCSFSPQDDQCLPQEVCAATLQRSRIDKGWSSLSGPLRRQIPGSSWEAWTQADRTLSPGWGNDEEGGRGKWIDTVEEEPCEALWKNSWEMGLKAVVSVRYETLWNVWVGFVGELKKTNKKQKHCWRTAERNCIFCCITGMWWTATARGKRTVDYLHASFKT